MYENVFLLNVSGSAEKATQRLWCIKSSFSAVAVCGPCEGDKDFSQRCTVPGFKVANKEPREDWKGKRDGSIGEKAA